VHYRIVTEAVIDNVALVPNDFPGGTIWTTVGVVIVIAALSAVASHIARRYFVEALESHYPASGGSRKHPTVKFDVARLLSKG
jgi:hypothetical protein